ncbi:MAG: DUF362 domain-containing protein, partial [Candidatus Bathyarchaeia archaeon]
HALTLIDGITGMEGNGPHAGFVCHPGVIIASPDMVAAEAIGHAVAGYHPLEPPSVQYMMKAGLGTGDLSEINIYGARLEDCIHPFLRFMPRYVQKYMNVTEYIGGTCFACLWGLLAVPPVVDPKKKYAVIAGTRASIANPLDGVDEAWLIGECACKISHQYPGYMDKVNAAKKIIRVPTCPGIDGLIRDKWGSVYDATNLLGADLCVVNSLPEQARPDALAAAENRREGRQTSL